MRLFWSWIFSWEGHFLKMSVGTSTGRLANRWPEWSQPHSHLPAMQEKSCHLSIFHTEATNTQPPQHHSTKTFCPLNFFDPPGPNPRGTTSSSWVGRILREEKKVPMPGFWTWRSSELWGREEAIGGMTNGNFNTWLWTVDGHLLTYWLYLFICFPSVCGIPRKNYGFFPYQGGKGRATRTS